ncbi:MAG TPA: glycosyltransferase [Candidatus Baltobacteraceae bacterium]|jgi:glycosyltransferase involved in cell wall biosynthesis|nr:glycosyltransferase [Candidatus Baltobacteraceae bacterium]
MLELSVVIPTRDRLNTLRHVIPALLRNDLNAECYEILVADSQSTDGTKEFLADVAREHPNVRHIPGPYTGRASARNAGIDAARGEVILFTDADIIASPTLLSTHLGHHRVQQGIAVVGMELQVGSLDEYERLRDNPLLRRPLHPNSRKQLSWLYFLTGNASARKRDLDQVGRFDEDFTGYGHEDLELGYRLEAAGIRILYDPNALDYHWHPVPYDEQKDKMRLAGRSTVRFYRKHRNFNVRLRLGMTPISLWMHDLLARSPRLRDWLEQSGRRRSGFARTVVYQYHYIDGIKDALAHERS